MKQSCKPKRHTARREAGIALVLFAFSLPVTLGLVFFAIDTANLYLTRQRLNKAVRVAASAYINLRTQNGWAAMVDEQTTGPSDGGDVDGFYRLKNNSFPNNSSFSPDDPAPQIVPKTGNACPYASILRDSLEWNLWKYPQYRGDFNTQGSSDGFLGVFNFTDNKWEYNAGNSKENSPNCRVLNQAIQRSINLGVPEQVSLQIGYAVRTFFLGPFSRLIGVTTCTKPDTTNANGNITIDDNRCWVTSDRNQRTASVQPANVYLLLDISGSMASDASPTDNTDDTTKIEYLKRAAGRFVDYFNPYRDFISVVPFNQGVNRTSQGNNREQPLTNFYQYNATSYHYGIKDSIRALTPYGQTNPCDGLISVINQINNPPTPPPGAPTPNPNAPNFVVLFTDGAPNVYRLDFCGGQANNPDCNPTAEPPGLTAARTNSAVANTSRQVPPRDSWYGWTVTWGQRALAGGRTSDPNFTPNDPVFGVPDTRNAQAQVSNPAVPNLRVDENGEWWSNVTGCRWGPGLILQCALGQTAIAPQKLSEQGLQLAVNPLTGSANNYRFNGPSYLVHNSFANWTDSRLSNLVDRIPANIANETNTLVTCGPPNFVQLGDPSIPMPYQYNINEQYNHARYFASRVVNSNWRLNTDGRAVGLQGNGQAPFGNNTTPQMNFLASVQELTNPAQPTPAPRPLPATSPGCLTHLNSMLPGTNGAAQIHVGPSFTSNAGNASFQAVGEVVKTAELPYYCAIRAADYLRTNNQVTVFVVGLGTSASTVYDQGNTACNDPMQNALDFDSRKDNFLRRLALAPEAVIASERANFVTDPNTMNSPKWDTAHDFTYHQINNNCRNQTHPLNGQNLTIGFSEANVSNGNPPGDNGPGRTPNQFPRNTIGAYYGANDPSQLSAIFAKVAKQILSRMGT